MVAAAADGDDEGDGDDGSQGSVCIKIGLLQPPVLLSSPAIFFVTEEEGEKSEQRGQ